VLIFVDILLNIIVINSGIKLGSLIYVNILLIPLLCFFGYAIYIEEKLTNEDKKRKENEHENSNE